MDCEPQAEAKKHVGVSAGERAVLSVARYCAGDLTESEPARFHVQPCITLLAWKGEKKWPLINNQ